MDKKFCFGSFLATVGIALMAGILVKLIAPTPITVNVEFNKEQWNGLDEIKGSINGVSRMIKCVNGDKATFCRLDNN